MEPPKGYLPISCEDCDAREHLEFGTHDGTNQGAVIMCPVCASGSKDYCARRYASYYDECFLGAAYCRYCESNVDLYVPEGLEYEKAQRVMCRKCIEEEEREAAEEAAAEAAYDAKKAAEQQKKEVEKAEEEARNAVEEAEEAATEAEESAQKAKEAAEKAREAIEKAQNLKAENTSNSDIQVTLK